MMSLRSLPYSAALLCGPPSKVGLRFIDKEAPGIGDITTPRRDILLGAAAKQIAVLEWRPRRALQLGGHISIRGIENEPLRTFAQHVVLDPGLHIALDSADQFPSSNQALAQL